MKPFLYCSLQYQFSHLIYTSNKMNKYCMLLKKKGMPFRTAYKITGGLVAHCIELNTTLEELPLDDYQKQSELFTEDVYDAISLDTCVKERRSFGGPAPESVKAQIELTRKKLEELCNG